MLQNPGHNPAETIIDLCTTLSEYVTSLEQALHVIATDLDTNLVQSTDYISIDRARQHAITARDKLLPGYAEEILRLLKGLKDLQRVAKLHIDNGHDQNNELQKALDNIAQETTARKAMTDEEILATANRIASPHGLRAEFLGETKAVGVTGDFRAYTRVLVLIGPWPGHEALAAIPNAISSETPITRVNIDITQVQTPLETES